MPSSPSNSHLSSTSVNTLGCAKRIFSESDMGIFLDKFSNFLIKMQFEKAKEIVDMERLKILFPANYRFWQYVMASMSQVLFFILVIQIKWSLVFKLS